MSTTFSNETDFQAMFELIPLAEARESARFRARFTENWAQGRTAFGGLVAAQMNAAIRRMIGYERGLRGMTVSFIGPVTVGEYEINVRIIRSGRTATWCESQVVQDDTVRTSVIACYGDARSSKIELQPDLLSTVPGLEQGRAFPFIAGMMPDFLQNYDIKWAIGDVPLSGSKSRELGAWARLRDGKVVDESRIIALLDLLPPAVLPMLTEMKPVSSLTWHITPLAVMSDMVAQEDWAFIYDRVDATGAGYSQQQSILFVDQQPVALCQQAIAVFE